MGNGARCSTGFLSNAKDNRMPVWDSIVLSKLRIKPSAYQDKEKRLAEAVRIYQEIDYWYKGFLQSEGSAGVLNAFDEAFPEYQNFTPVKKVDFLFYRIQACKVRTYVLIWNQTDVRETKIMECGRKGGTAWNI